MFTVHATRKLLDRVKQPRSGFPLSNPRPALGNWYATAIFWKPQVSLFVNERTLLPVAGAPWRRQRTLWSGFPEFLRQVLVAPRSRPFLRRQPRRPSSGTATYAKTASRSILGIINEFTYLGGFMRDELGPDDLLQIALELSETPCGPLYKRCVSPDRELRAVVNKLARPTTLGDLKWGLDQDLPCGANKNRNL